MDEWIDLSCDLHKLGANLYSKLPVAPYSCKKVGNGMDGWMGGWVDGRKEGCKDGKVTLVQLEKMDILYLVICTI